MIVLTGRFRSNPDGRMHSVISTAFLPVFELFLIALIVDELVLGPGVIGSVMRLLDMIKEPAVRTLAHLPIKLQVKAAVIFPRHQVSARVHAVLFAMKFTVDDFPTVIRFVLVCPPLSGSTSVE